MNLKLVRIDLNTDTSWDDYILNHSKSSIYHTSGWLKAITSSFNLTPILLGIAKTHSGELNGIIPFMRVNNVFSRKKIISIPLSTHAEFLFSLSEFDSIFELIKKEFPEDFSVEFRSKLNCNLSNFIKDESYILHVLELDNNIDHVFKQFHPTSIRASIRRAEKNALEFSLVEDENGLIIFYNLYIGLRSRLGLPPLPYKFFKSVWQNLMPENRIFIPIIKYKGKPISAGFILKFKDTFYLEYTASDKSYFKLYPNHKLFWEIIKIAIKENAKYVDFGRTNMANRSLQVFKEKWNAKPIPLYYYSSNKKNINSSPLRKIITIVNKRLPKSMLKLEGKFFYKYFL